MSASSTDSPLDRVPIVKSVVGGLAAYIASFVLIAVVVAAMEDGDDLIGGAGNILYAAHFVDSETSFGGQTQTGNFITDGSLEAPDLLYQAIPIVVLLVAGIALVRYLEIPDETDAAIAGAAMAVGYLVLTIVGTFVFEIEQSAMGSSVTTSPQLGAMTIIVMGIVYPAVVGGIGGVIGTKV